MTSSHGSRFDSPPKGWVSLCTGIYHRCKFLDRNRALAIGCPLCTEIPVGNNPRLRNTRICDRCALDRTRTHRTLGLLRSCSTSNFVEIPKFKKMSLELYLNEFFKTKKRGGNAPDFQVVRTDSRRRRPVQLSTTR